MGIKWDFNLLVFVVWMVFNYLCFCVYTYTHTYTHTHTHTYIYIYIYTCLFSFMCVCVCVVHVLFNLDLNLSIKFPLFEVTCSRCLIDLHNIKFSSAILYRCFETVNFLFSSILILRLWSDVLAFSACVDPTYISLHLLHSIMYTTFLSCSLSVYLFWIWFQGF